MANMGKGWPKDGFGMAPPWGAYRGLYSDYERAQFGSMGSGLLGGASFLGHGISVETDHPAHAEEREELQRLAHARRIPQ